MDLQFCKKLYDNGVKTIKYYSNTKNIGYRI